MNGSTSKSVDADLWQRFKNGSEDAYRHLYDHFAPILYSYGCKITRDDSLVKDCLQDLFYNIGRKRQSLTNLPDEISIKYYLFCALRHEIIHKMNARPALTDYPERVTDHYIERSAEEIIIMNEDIWKLRQALTQAISKLSPRQQEAIYLRFYENTSFEDIAAIMGITPRGVYKLIYRSISALQKTYKPPAGIDAEILSVPLILVLLLFV